MVKTPWAPIYLFISGGVISGLGKGITAASIGLLLQSRGYRVTPIKCENYLNLDSGLINPIEHGDPFLCEDGAETDMDIGTYERFLDKNLTIKNFITMGQIYHSVITRERSFDYAGEDIEAIPHVTDEIIRRLKVAAREDAADIVIVELGGTAGEYQNSLYYEASRIMRLKHKDTVLHIHVSYVPTPPHLGEPKTKPTQLSVKILNSMGIQPDIIVARSDDMIDRRRRERFALFCNVEPEDIVSSPNVSSIYEVPLILAEQKIDERILDKVNLPKSKANLSAWKTLVKKIKSSKEKTITLSIVGKYFATGDFVLGDSYAALFEALHHASWAAGVNLDIRRLNSQKVEAQGVKLLAGSNAVVVPIGWGERGVDGKLIAIEYARKNKIPYLGLCYGMQLAVVEFARHVAGLKGAHSTEVDPRTPHPVIHIIPEQKRILKNRAYGGTMRLGAWQCLVKKDTHTWRAYERHHQFLNEKTGLTSERHRHRYEFNEAYTKLLTDKGLIIAGRSVKESLVEIIELPQTMHPFFVGTQGHPEYKSRPLRPHGLFVEFIQAAKTHAQG
ncbi:MAG: CTP synthase [Candidatus Chisholmbacteria bacterium]|nr:CTP synthase [Candidatus Chisholmbacteria bacterium]